MSSSSTRTSVRGLQRVTWILSAVLALLVVFHGVALRIVGVTCPVFVGMIYQGSLTATLVGLLGLAPLWLATLVSLAIERRGRALLVTLAAAVAIAAAALQVFAVSLFYCDGDALATALQWHGH